MSAVDLNQLSRRELQAIAKQHGVKANMKNDELRRELSFVVAPPKDAPTPPMSDSEPEDDDSQVGDVFSAQDISAHSWSSGGTAASSPPPAASAQESPRSGAAGLRQRTSGQRASYESASGDSSDAFSSQAAAAAAVDHGADPRSSSASSVGADDAASEDSDSTERQWSACQENWGRRIVFAYAIGLFGVKYLTTILD